MLTCALKLNDIFAFNRPLNGDATMARSLDFVLAEHPAQIRQPESSASPPQQANGIDGRQRQLPAPHLLSFSGESRTLMGCTDPLRRDVGAPHQCSLGSVARYLIYADVRTFR